jgi:2,3-bisphosphoglycerate-independent phosphoglycerate mutase
MKLAPCIEAQKIIHSILFFIFTGLLVSPAGAFTYIDAGDIDTPGNMVLLIIDGMGSKYITPGSIPTAMDGTHIKHAYIPVLENVISNGVIVPEVRVRVPKTGPAHSVIITGYSKAGQETVEFTDATIYDVLKKEGFLSVAIMHKGDFTQLRNEQDIILYTESDAIKNASFMLQINNNNVPVEIVKELEYWEQEHTKYQKDTKGIDSYTAYADWELNATEHIISFMAEHYPEIRYILTINIGAVDCAGHYRGVKGYIESIEGLDKALWPLYTAALRSNTALIITSDYGMAFRSANASRGGHASDDYFCSEVLLVPLIMVSPNIIPGRINLEYDQQDLAPTLLSILDIPHTPEYTDGEVIPVKKYFNLQVRSDAKVDVEILQNTDRVSSGTGDSIYFFTGLKPETYYTVRVTDGNEILEDSVRLDVDGSVKFINTVSHNAKKEYDSKTWRRQIASVLILLVIITGLLVISRITE